MSKAEITKFCARPHLEKEDRQKSDKICCFYERGEIFLRDLEKAGVITMSDYIVSSTGVSVYAKEVNIVNPSNDSMRSLIIFVIKLWLLLKEIVRGFIKYPNTAYKN